MQRFIQCIRQRYPTSSTATHYQNDLEQFGRVVDKAPRAVTRAEVSQFVSVELAEDLSPATVNRRLASLSSFFEFLADEAGDDHWANPVVWRLHRVRQGRHLPRDLSEAVARQFWPAVCLGPVRDQAIVALMLDAGLRVREVTALRVQDFEAALQPAELCSLHVRGKGDKERRVWLATETAALVHSWLAQRGARFQCARHPGPGEALHAACWPAARSSVVSSFAAYFCSAYGRSAHAAAQLVSLVGPQSTQNDANLH
jgi:site-specific recombinase XerD